MGATVITSIVMINAATDSIPEVAEAIADIDGVSEVYSVAGAFDLIGVRDTETHIAFRAYSRHDLEAAFAIGFDDTE